MNKTDIIKSFANRFNVPQTAAADIVLGVFNSMAKALQQGEEVVLPAIGKLKVAEAKARTGRNPRTGETVAVPARKKVVLKVGKELKDAMNSKG